MLRISTIKLPGSPLKRAGVGLGLAALAQFLALFLAGSGHGWVAPFFFSLGLWLLIPFALALTATRPEPVLSVLAAIGLACDALLIERSLGEASYISRYVQVNGTLGILFIGLWLCLWVSWQAVVVRSLFARSFSKR